MKLHIILTLLLNPSSIKYTKLKGDLQQILESLGQFLLININFFKLTICEWHPLRFVIMLVFKKIFFVLIWDPKMPNIWWAKKPTMWKMDLCFSHHSIFFWGYFWCWLNIFWKFVILSSQVLSLVHWCWQFVQKYLNCNLFQLLNMHNQLYILTHDINDYGIWEAWEIMIFYHIPQQ